MFVYWGYLETMPAEERNLLQTEQQCKIKGNISKTTGEKIYHLPGDKYYDQTKIDAFAGEKVFCTESEAIKAGWRHSKI